MSEYYFDFWQWRDFKQAIEDEDWKMIQYLARSVENRWWTLQVAQAAMINEFKYPYNSGG